MSAFGALSQLSISDIAPGSIFQSAPDLIGTESAVSLSGERSTPMLDGQTNAPQLSGQIE